MANDMNLRAIISVVDKISGPMKQINRALRGPIKAMRDVNRATRGMGNAVSNLVTPLGLSIGGLTAGLSMGAAGVVRTSAQFERFQSMLEAVEGSADAAKKSMGWIQDFAAKTPYQLSEVTDAFARLKATGLEPTDGLLRTLGDAAAITSGKGIVDAVEMISDAVRGENERLKAFYIKARKVGDEFVYSYEKDGKKFEVRAKNNAMSIQKALAAALSHKSDGAMQKLSKTWDGMRSNLQDTFAKVQLSIGNSGFFGFMKGQLKRFMDLIGVMEKNGELAKWSKEVSDGLTALVKPISNFLLGYEQVNKVTGEKKNIPGLFQKLPEILKDIKDFLVTSGDVVESIGGWKTVAIAVGAILAGPFLVSLMTLGGAILSLGAPILVAIAGIAALAGLLIGNWDVVGPYFEDMWQSVKNVFVNFGEWVKSFFIKDGLFSEAGAAAAGNLFKSLLGVVWSLHRGVASICRETLLYALDLINDLIKTITNGFDFKALILDQMNSIEWPSWMTDGLSWVGGTLNAVDSYFDPTQEEGNESDFSSQALTPATLDRKALHAPERTAPGQTALNGEMVVRFENAPPGLRVSPGRTNQRDVLLNPDVGYRSMVTP